MATHSSILPWIIPRTEEPGGLQSAHGVTTERLILFHFALLNVGCIKNEWWCSVVSDS